MGEPKSDIISTDNKGYRELKAEDFQKKDPKKHVLDKPSSYIGSVKRFVRNLLVVDEELNYEYKNVDISQGLERLFIEILSNAADHTRKSKGHGFKDQIEVHVINNEVRIKNYGIPMCIDFSKENNMYIPELIFGNMFSSSNYDDENNPRTGAGTNGIGSKAVNVFSKEFEVTIFNSTKKKKYHQIWKNNMNIVSEPEITNYYGKISSVEIKYIVDNERFDEPENYRKDAIDLFRRHSIESSVEGGITVFFNDKNVTTKEKEYILKVYGEKVASTAIYQKGKLKDGGDYSLVALYTPNKSKITSFVNGINTNEGGVHIDFFMKKIGKYVLDKANKKLQSLGLKKLNMNSVKPNVSLFLSISVNNPEFESQSKRFLTDPQISTELPATFFTKINKWDLVELLITEGENKVIKKTMLTTKKKRKMESSNKYIDAEWADSNKIDKKRQTSLYICEGDSAKTYVVSLFSVIPNGRESMGIIPLKGKLLNTMKNNDLKIFDNGEIKKIVEYLGLEYGTDYTSDKNFNRLRYNSVTLITDADVDGHHIQGLVMCFFQDKFPSLIKRGFIRTYITPIIKATKGKKLLRFYQLEQFEQWLKEDPKNSEWHAKYYKGLATSTAKEVVEDGKFKIIVCNEANEGYDEKLNMIFNDDSNFRSGEKLSDQRKEWINSREYGLPPLDYKKLNYKRPITEFLDRDVREYSASTLTRALPALTDGFKDSQRKIIYGAIKILKQNATKGKKGKKEMRLDIFCAEVYSMVDYHHGDVSLQQAAIKLAQNYPSSNNINLLLPNGQFGTRQQNGDDKGSSRYIYTFANPILNYIIKEEDNNILEYNVSEEDGENVEPKRYYPIIPLSLVNGINGVATGWSTKIPNYNPLDIIDWLKWKLNNEKGQQPWLVPWYKDFKGKISIVLKEDVKLMKNNSVLKFDNKFQPKKIDHSNFDRNEPEKYKVVILGNYKTLSNNDVLITEVPIFTSGDSYHDKLKKKLLNTKKIDDIVDKCMNDEKGVYRLKYVLKKYKGPISYKNLFLQDTVSLSNMNLLDEKDKVVKYNSV